MADKFTFEEHQKRMRDILKPQPVGGSVIDRLRLAGRKLRSPKVPKVPEIR